MKRLRFRFLVTGWLISFAEWTFPLARLWIVPVSFSEWVVSIAHRRNVEDVRRIRALQGGVR